MSSTGRKGGLSPIAVDFGVSSLKLLQVAYAEEPQLVGVAQLETPPELLMRDKERVAYQLTQLPIAMRGGGFKGKRAAFTISAAQTFVTRAMVPGMNHGSGGVKEALGQYLMMSVGLDPAALILRPTEVGEVVSPDGKRRAVLCVAMPRDVVHHHMESFRGAKLETVGVQAEHMAVVRLFDCITRECKRSEPAHALYVDIGYGSTKLMATRGRELVSAATVPIGGRDFDGPTARERGCTLIEARRRRVSGETGWCPADKTFHADLWERVGTLEAAVAEAERTHGTLNEEISVGGVAQLAEAGDEPAGVNALDALSDELTMFLRSHRAVFPESVISRCVFLGGESRRVDVAEHLSACAALPGAVCDPMAGVKGAGGETINGVDFTSPRPDWAAALGLAFSPTEL